MRLLALLLGATLLYVPLSYGKTSEIEFVIQELQPNIKPHIKKQIAKDVLYLTNYYDLEWERYLSILFQESSLRVDPKNCLRDKPNCQDVGIGQVSYRYWGKKLKINRKRALKDLNYAILLSFKVYIHYFRKYYQVDRVWYTRYHSGTSKLRKGYEKRIDAHYGKIKVAKQKFRRTLLNEQGKIYSKKDEGWQRRNH